MVRYVVSIESGYSISHRGFLHRVRSESSTLQVSLKNRSPPTELSLREDYHCRGKIQLPVPRVMTP